SGKSGGGGGSPSQHRPAQLLGTPAVAHGRDARRPGGQRADPAGSGGAGGPQRHPGRTGPAECACETFSRFARPGYRGGQENGLPATGNEPRGQHAAFEDLGPGGRSLEDYGDGPADEVGNREIARAGTESGMSQVK